MGLLAGQVLKGFVGNDPLINGAFQLLTWLAPAMMGRWGARYWAGAGR